MLTFDFSGIYENEGFDFCKENDPRSLFENIVSLKDISGTNCICDEYAEAQIKDRILNVLKGKGDFVPSDAEEDDERSDGVTGPDTRMRHLVRFFDSGNYHYMSKLLIDLLCEHPDLFDCTFDKMDLVMFDHHPDMKWTSYGDILSCGSWVLNALKDRQELENVYIIGADRTLIKEVQEEHPEYSGRVFFLEHADELPVDKMSKEVYISVDKDVLDESELSTNWDQGEMSLSELESSLEFLRDSLRHRILAVDVCGECSADDEALFSELGIEKSNLINKMIAEIFENIS